jgi:hypothetical protein
MKRIITFLITLLLIITLSACSVSQAATSTGVTPVQNTNTTSSEGTVASTAAVSVADASAENSATHEDAQDYVWDAAQVVPITLNGDSITVNGNGVVIDGSKATITSAGTYSISGSLADGQIIVNTKNKEVVRLVLNGVDLHSSTSAPIYVMEAEKTVIILADNTENTITDADSYVFEVPAEEEPNAAIFSKSDLTIFGNGSLTVKGNYYDGISSKDGLIIASGRITVNAVDDGIRGKDYLVVKEGTITVNAQGDGLKADNETDASMGYVAIEKGVFNITSVGDAIHAQTDVLITDGDFTLSAGGGSSNRVDGTTSTKGIKGTVNVNIDAGTFSINSADDAVHSNGSITINGGTFNITAGDDGMHADATLTINNGEIHISESYEGLESAVITINDGNIHVAASDDGVNGAGGNDSSGARQGGGPGQDTFSGASDYYLYIHGGYLYVDANGDGIDINGSIEMTDGVVLVNGPTQQMNGALDYDASFNMTGGFFVAAGSSGMAMAPSQSSSQSSVLVYLTAAQAAGTLVHIQNSAGEDILTFAPTKQYQSISFSSPELVNGTTYTISTGGSSTGTNQEGLYQDGSYSSGTENASFKVSSTVTTVGSGGRRMGPRP